MYLFSEECPLEDTCTLARYVTAADFEPRNMLGVWSLSGKQGPGDYESFDMKLRYVAENEYNFTMTGRKYVPSCRRYKPRDSLIHMTYVDVYSARMYAFYDAFPL